MRWWVLIVLSGLVLGCAPPATPMLSSPYREEPVWTEDDFRQRHDRMLYHVIEQPGETRRSLEHEEQRSFEYELRAWEAMARRQQQFVAAQKARRQRSTAYFDRLQERIKVIQAERERRRMELTSEFLKRAERLRGAAPEAEQ